MRTLSSFVLPAVGITAIACSLLAAPPAGYYNSANGLTGTALRNALHNIIDDHQVIPYSSSRLDVYDACEDLDEDPSNTRNVRLMYSNATTAKSSRGNWNREHTWPQSYGVSRGPGNSDLHHIFACDTNVNSSRGNKYYDNGGTSFHPEAPECRYDDNSWQVRTQDRGNIARAILYMDVRYNGDKSGELDLFCGEATGSETPRTGGRFMGKLATLIAWHNQDPPDAAEMARNDKIYYDYQNNRNPFIDNPAFVAAIWGGGSSTGNPGNSSGNPNNGATTITFYSNPAFDGNVLELTDSNRVGQNRGTSTFGNSFTVRVGDYYTNGQYRGVFHFDTSTLPDGANIESAVLKIRADSFNGNPQAVLGSLVADVTSLFSGSASLQASDWEASATLNVANLSYPSVGGLASGNLNASGISQINKTGPTQFRVRFTNKTDNNNQSTYINFLAGENGAADRPVLEVTYR